MSQSPIAEISEPQPADLFESSRVREQRRRNQSAIDLLDSWARADEDEIQEQKETWEFLRQALDEDKPSYRKLFPCE
jgi:hypothetical protein